MNEQRQPAKRYNEAQLRRKTEKHLKEFIENLESQLKRTIPDEYDRPEDWIRLRKWNLLNEKGKAGHLFKKAMAIHPVVKITGILPESK